MEYQKAMLQMTTQKIELDYSAKMKREMEDEQSVKFAKALMSAGGTFEFTSAHKEIGYSTIFEAMAAEFHEQGANLKTKVKNGEAHEHEYRNGCSLLNAKLMTHWSGFIIYSIPRMVNDKSIQVITMDGDFVVNSLGQTAAQVHVEREKKRSHGQLAASAKKLTRSVGQQKAVDTLRSIVDGIEALTVLPNGTMTEALPE